MITTYASVETAVTATKMGAFDFVTKPLEKEELLLVVQNGLEKRKLKSENHQLRKQLREQFVFEKVVGRSQRMQEVFGLIAQVAPRRSTVLIQGESGTGKELVAKTIHNQSTRSKTPFVTVNTGSIQSDLLESELFGHVKGAFASATSNKKGLFELADAGTMFLDEVGTIAPEMQSKLLRVIQEKEFRRVGGLDNISVDVRIIAATNADLRQAMEEGRFREDLYYRLNVICIQLPPLRERREDIPLLMDHFIRKFGRENGRGMCTWETDARRLLMEYDWPGNVRELENVVERAVALAPENNCMSKRLLPPELARSGMFGPKSIDSKKKGRSLKDRVLEFEKSLISSALRETAGDQKEAARLLRVKHTTLNEKVKRLNIETWARVRDLMHRGNEIPKVTVDTPMEDVIYEMSRKSLGITSVVGEEDRLIGVISDGDLLRLLQREGKDVFSRSAGQCMTSDPVTIRAGAFATGALHSMAQRKITSLMVTEENGRLVGVIHLHDLWGAQKGLEQQPVSRSA